MLLLEKANGQSIQRPRVPPRNPRSAGGPGKTTTPILTADPRVEQELIPPFNVVLLNDDDHTFEYVVEMLRALFGHPPWVGWHMAWEVHRQGRSIVCTTSKERAELKRDQIHAYGRDPRVPRCKGSMSAIIEPSE